MKIKKEDLIYSAGVATGMSKGSNKPPKLKHKYKFKHDVSSLSGMMTPYYEENKKNFCVFLEEIEIDKRRKNKKKLKREGVAEIEFTNNSMDSYSETLVDLPNSGKNNPTEE